MTERDVAAERPSGRRIYVASSWRNEHQQGVVSALRQAGHEVYDFRNPAPGNAGFAWSAIDPDWLCWTPERFAELVSKHPVAKDGFGHDKRALDWCNTCVLVLPCGRSAHLEAGYAAGQGKEVFFLLHPDRFEPELMYELGSGYACSVAELLPKLALPAAIRPEPDADAVKLVDAAIEAACTWQEHGDTTDIDNEDNAVAARAALLDYIAAKDAEIEQLKSELVDEATAHLSTMNNADAAKAELARLKAAHVPKVLRRLSEAASLMDDGPVSWTKFCVAAGRWVRSLLAAQPAPAPARQGPSATDVIEDRKVYDHECSRLLAKMDSLLHDLEAQSGSVGERAAEAHVALHELCTRLVDNEIAWPARQDSDEDEVEANTEREIEAVAVGLYYTEPWTNKQVEWEDLKPAKIDMYMQHMIKGFRERARTVHALFVETLSGQHARQDSDAVALLREIEWAGEAMGIRFCLFCHRDDGFGHASDCRLAKAIKQTGDA